jgi:hypothetical protein
MLPITASTLILVRMRRMMTGENSLSRDEVTWRALRPNIGSQGRPPLTRLSPDGSSILPRSPVIQQPAGSQKGTPHYLLLAKRNP